MIGIWTVQNVIDSKNQMKFKVLLANWWSPSPEVGGYTSTIIRRRNEKHEYYRTKGNCRKESCNVWYN